MTQDATMTWPGVRYPWTPWMPGYVFPPPVDPLNAASRICLGNQCWPYARLSLADADRIKAVLLERSWPLAEAGLAAVALYDRGYWSQARAILRVYGGVYGVDEVAQQIERVYQGTTGPSVVPTGVGAPPGRWWLFAPTTPVQPTPVVQGRQVQQVLTETNARRAAGAQCPGGQSFGPAPALRISSALSQAAQKHSEDMGRRGYLEHTSPDGEGPLERARAAGYRGGYLGENIAGGQTSAKEVVDGWMGSAVHCPAIMTPEYNVIGIGYAQVPGSPLGTYWTQLFGKE